MDERPKPARDNKPSQRRAKSRSTAARSAREGGRGTQLILRTGRTPSTTACSLSMRNGDQLAVAPQHGGQRCCDGRSVPTLRVSAQRACERQARPAPPRTRRRSRRPRRRSMRRVGGHRATREGGGQLCAPTGDKNHGRPAELTPNRLSMPTLIRAGHQSGPSTIRSA